MKKLLSTLLLFALVGCSTVKDLDLGNIVNVVKDEVVDQREAEEPPKDLEERLSRLPQRWLGEDFSKLPITVNLRGASYHGIHLTYDFDIPSSWTTGYPSKRVPEQEQYGIAVVARIRDGVLVGGMYDYLRCGSKVKGMQPLEKGYMGHTVPAKDEEHFTLVLNLLKTGRSNWTDIYWQGRR